MKNTDLHVHSVYSDGFLTPKELVRRAKRNKLKYIALTDHNSIEGNEETIKEGKKVGVEVIPGVEVSSEWGEVLGYFVDSKNKKLMEIMKRSKKEVDTQTKQGIKKLQKLGFDVSYEKVKKKFPKYPMLSYYVALYLTDEGLLEEWQDLYNHINLTYHLPKMERVIKIIKKSGGVPILAHPFRECKFDEVVKNISKLIKAGLAGFEIENAQCKGNYSEIKRKCRELANKYDLILTSGSDFHGKYVETDIGDKACDENVIEELRRLVK